MKIKKLIHDLLTTTKAERNGALVLSVILLILIVVRFVIPSIIDSKKKPVDIDLMISKIEAIEDSIAKAIYESEIQSDYQAVSANRETPNEIQYFDFDPNTVSREQLLKLGIRQRTVNTFINFRNRGAVFSKPEDVLKVYGIDSIAFEKIKPYIRIEIKDEIIAKKNERKVEVDNKSNGDSFTFEEDMPVLQAEKETFERDLFELIEMNTADTVLLTTLRGIGPFYARRIVNFRNSLGGFASVNQLQEVYNLPEETFHNIKDKVSVDSSLIVKININFAEISDLRAHPYCNYAMAKAIVDYRTLNGSYKELNQLLADSVITHEAFSRFSVYLTVR